VQAEPASSLICFLGPLAIICLWPDASLDDHHHDQGKQAQASPPAKSSFVFAAAVVQV
jgi:hypothetical protein